MLNTVTNALPTKVRPIAFYLPQFHPIPENDEWWGKGFTEWTNVTKAKPLFPGHQQPKLPTDLGFYDLRVAEIRQQQADLAKQAGIEGFCYWHYWFGEGRKILRNPLDEVLKLKAPDFPFCICWANGSWSRIWSGMERTVLIKQEYLGVSDYTDFFYDSLPIFQDPRYIQVDGKPLFIIFAPMDIPDLPVFVEVFRSLANKEGLGDFFIIGMDEPNEYLNTYLDGTTPNLPGGSLERMRLKRGLHQSFYRRCIQMQRNFLFHVLHFPKIIKYRFFVEFMYNDNLPLNVFPCVIPNWDNTARKGRRGNIFFKSTPELFELHLKKACAVMGNRPYQSQLLFIKAWNEWAEGNYLEPDRKHGSALLEVCQKLFV